MSNSWLNSDYGNNFIRALKYFYDIEIVVTSGSGRWFKNAKVVTNIVILRKRQDPTTISNALTKLVVLKVNIDSVDSDDALNIRALINTHDSYNGSMLTISSCLLGDVNTMPASAYFTELSWLAETQKKSVLLKTVFKIARGERRGWDDLFFPSAPSSIEPEYLSEVLKSPRSLKGLLAEGDGLAFCCEKSIAELHDAGHYGALNWINKFESRNNETGKSLIQVLKRPGMNWYTMRPDTLADIVTAVNPGDRLFFGRFVKPTFVNQRLIRMSLLNKEHDILLLHALLNSILGLFYIEALGFGRGEGALDLNSDKLEKSMRILDPSTLDDRQRSEIIKLFEPILNRPVKQLPLETESGDRIKFDMGVLAAYGLEHLYSEIKQSLLQLYAIRNSVNH